NDGHKQRELNLLPWGLPTVLAEKDGGGDDAGHHQAGQAAVAEWPYVHGDVIEWQPAQDTSGVEGDQQHEPEERRGLPTAGGDVEQADGEICETDEAEDLGIGEPDPRFAGGRGAAEDSEDEDDQRSAAAF